MEYKNLGKSGLKVSQLSLGSWLTFGKQIGNSIAGDLMDLAYDNGVNFFDNAEIYAKGESEQVMGEILKCVLKQQNTKPSAGNPTSFLINNFSDTLTLDSFTM